MTSQDIKSITFDKGMRGYRVEDVDAFMMEISGVLEDIEHERDAALAARKEMEGKMYILAQKVEEYRGQEETLKTALINAQRMGETVVMEAKQKAETMVRDATMKTEMLRDQAEQDILNEQKVLETMRSEVTRFKATVLNLYKQHIESLSALDAPVAHVEDVLEDYDTAYGEDLDQEFEIDEEEFKEYIPAARESAMPPKMPVPPVNEQPVNQAAEAPVMNLFEGVQIENNYN